MSDEYKSPAFMALSKNSQELMKLISLVSKPPPLYTVSFGLGWSLYQDNLRNIEKLDALTSEMTEDEKRESANYAHRRDYPDQYKNGEPDLEPRDAPDCDR